MKHFAWSISDEDGDWVFNIDLFLMVSHACTQNFRTVAPFLLVGKLWAYKERRKKEKKEETKKLTYEDNGHLGFPVTRLPKPTLVPILTNIVYHILRKINMKKTSLAITNLSLRGLKHGLIRSSLWSILLEFMFYRYHTHFYCRCPAGPRSS